MSSTTEDNATPNRMESAVTGSETSAAADSSKCEGKKVSSVVIVANPIYQEFGQGIYTDEKGKYHYNQNSIARRFAEEGKVLFDPKKGSFLKYSESSGLWTSVMEYNLKGELSLFLRAVAREHGLPDFARTIKPALLNSILSMIQNVAIVPESTVDKSMFAVANGVLDLSSGAAVLRDSGSGFMFTTGCPYKYDDTATCPKFESMLKGALNEDDIRLIQRYFGSVILGANQSHGILVLTGTAGGGKSTLVTILEGIIGLENVAYLRASHLSGRFEFSGFKGKRLLAGKDVPGDTLTSNGAKLMKCLTGGDLLESETKYVAGKDMLRGDFHVILASNSRLKIAFDGDEDAWRRRLLVVEYTGEKPKNVVPNLASQLLKEEGSGILSWLVRGAEAFLKSGFQLSASQNAKIDAVIAESQTVTEFVRKRLKMDKNSQVAVQEITKDYFGFCSDNGWIPLTDRQLHLELPKVMKKVHGVVKSHDVPAGDREVRGFRGVALVS